MEEVRTRNLSKRILCTLFAAALLFTGAVLPASAQAADEDENSIVTFLSLIGLNYDSEKELLEAKNGKGLMGTGFNYDIGQSVFYASNYCWQRNFGYSTFYDDMAPAFNMNFDCLRFYFDYGGKSWLIETWKGQYGITTGCELGLYYKPMDREIKHYDCVEDEDMLPLSVKLYHNGETLFERGPDKSWWQTGFIVFRTDPAEELSMDFSIRFKDKDMLKAFKKAITDDMNITYSTKGTTFYCSWDIK